MKPADAVKPSTNGPNLPRGKEPEGEEGVAAPTPPKTGILPTGLSRAMVIGSFLLVSAVVGVGLFGDRYTIISAVRTENAIVYRIDRMTGRVSFCSPAACVPIAEKSEMIN